MSTAEERALSDPADEQAQELELRQLRALLGWGVPRFVGEMAACDNDLDKLAAQMRFKVKFTGLTQNSQVDPAV
jgi:hypothetical protein